MGEIRFEDRNDLGDTLEQIAESALAIHPDFVVLAELDTESTELVITYANAAAERILGKPMSEIVGRRLRTLMADERLFATRSLRESFFRRLRDQGELEFPGVIDVKDGRGGKRHLRIRLSWPPNGRRVLAVGEDVTHRQAREEHSGAHARLNAAMEVGGLLSHHINNALGAAMLEVGTARLSMQPGDPALREIGESLERAIDHMRTASQVLAALTATTQQGSESEQSSDLFCVLCDVLDELAEEGRVRIEGAPDPCWVWGAERNVKAVLRGVLPLLIEGTSNTVDATLRQRSESVSLRLRVAGVRGDALQSLMDPSVVQGGLDSRPVTLFAAIQVLHSLGGRLGIPTLSDGALAVELDFRRAPGPVAAPERPAPVLVVTGDGALRAVVSSVLAPWPVEYTESIREGIVRVLRPDGGVVVCDMDALDFPLEELLALLRASGREENRRLILASRAEPAMTELPLSCVHIPFDGEEFLNLVAQAAEKEEKE